MRSLDESPWFKNATLENVVAIGGSDANSFVLTVFQDSPNSKREEEKQ